jgi:hypothetical protein
VAVARQSLVHRQDVKPELRALPGWAHPQVAYWYDDWRSVRDCMAGEKEIKAETTRYLPKFDGFDRADYAAYLDRATFYNFTGRTVGALVGTIFRRAYIVRGIPERMKSLVTDRITRDSQSLDTFMRLAATDVVALGRFGVLVDLPVEPTTEPQPYIAAYPAEHILDWDYQTVAGRDILSRVVLREFYPQANAKAKGGRKGIGLRYRELLLEGGVYKQRVYENADGSEPSLDGMSVEHTPQIRGQTIKFIPFHFFGVVQASPTVEKPPMLDIAQLNIHHYRSYAHLEHGRYYTGMPVYYTEVGQGEGGGEYKVGPSVVWEVPFGHKPGLLEFNGQGLKFLENALDQKEQQAASLGGRMMGVRSLATTESDNQLKLKERNEQVHLINATVGLDAGFKKILGWVVQFAGGSEAEAKKVEVIFNKDFLFDGIGSREFRAILAMYKDGILPIDVVFTYLQKAEVIPDWMSQDEFKKLLDDDDQFPNNADVEARREGFAGAQAKQSKEIADDKIELGYAELDAAIVEAEAALEDAKKARADAAKAAAKAPAPLPGQPGKPGAPSPKPAAKPASKV